MFDTFSKKTKNDHFNYPVDWNCEAWPKWKLSKKSCSAFSGDVLSEIVHLHGPLYSLFSEWFILEILFLNDTFWTRSCCQDNLNLTVYACSPFLWLLIAPIDSHTGVSMVIMTRTVQWFGGTFVKMVNLALFRADIKS